GTGRLHDLFINIEGMTPGEFKNGGENLIINYSFAGSIFGNIMVASTQKGICHIAFVEAEETAVKNLYASFPKANFTNSSEPIHHQVKNIFTGNEGDLNKLKLHLKGTPFQLKVWEELLKIPMGKLATYGNIAHTINKPKASRAVGSAIGHNPVAFLIPCHRVIQATGLFGQYMWGEKRKTAMIGWEAVRLTIN
ncbi:MAG: methylated-DNA--[protein]-cysteine S-methyltransferase, partial [Ferruginibacter sp.]|nr:methylated-DNA--[protein]-cysteine S-methyltransferase [Ferruginibacter sp.]